MDITYYNANGTSISLNTPPYHVAGAMTSVTSVWEYNAVNRPNGYGEGCPSPGLSRNESYHWVFRGNTRLRFNANALALMALTEPDIPRRDPSKLYLGRPILNLFPVCFQ